MGAGARLGSGVAMALLLAGCLGAAPPQDLDAAAAVRAGLALLADATPNGHDHTDARLHPGVAWNLEPVWAEYVPLDGFTRAPPSEFVIWRDLAFVSTFQPFAGFVIISLEDPERPRQVGAFNAGSAYTNDVEVTDDGRWAFVPTQPFYPPEDGLDGGLVRAGDYGVQVVDVSDPADPRLAAVHVSGDPSGYHRLDLEFIQGSWYVFGTGYGLGRVDILRFDQAPVPRLVPVAFYQAPEAVDPRTTYLQGSGPYSNGVHDLTVDPDPLEGFPLLAVSYWAAGAHFLDVSDPANPRLLGVWDAYTELTPGNVHNVMFTAVEGVRLAVAVPEFPNGHERHGLGILWIVDVTDFAAPRLHGTWRLPGEHVEEEGIYVYTTDRVEVRQGTLFVAHFHAGVIVLDFDTLDKARDPPLLGFAVPPGTEPMRYMGMRENPLVYDALPRGEHLYYTDLTGKFHVARMGDAVLRGKAWDPVEGERAATLPDAGEARGPRGWG